jgi:hypothetical protein
MPVDVQARQMQSVIWRRMQFEGLFQTRPNGRRYFRGKELNALGDPNEGLTANIDLASVARGAGRLLECSDLVDDLIDASRNKTSFWREHLLIGGRRYRSSEQGRR